MPPTPPKEDRRRREVRRGFPYRMLENLAGGTLLPRSRRLRPPT